MVQWKNNNTNKNKGFTIIEIIIAIIIVVIAFSAILGFLSFESKISERGRIRLAAISLAREGMEAVRNFRDNTSWNLTGVGNLVVNTDYHPASSSVGWNIVSGSENIDRFARVIRLSKVSRDANGNIESAYNPASDDQNTRKITVTVSWTDRQGSTSENLATYITNWRE